MLFVIICSFVAGIILTLVGQFLFLRRWFRSLPTVTSNWKPQTESYLLPKELSDALKDEAVKKPKESCLSLNLVLQFLFQELKDTKRIRRWAMKRMKLEFEEMLRSTTGKLLEHITVRDFNLGRTFPIIQNASVGNISVNEDNVIEEVTLLLDLTYNGRFQLAVDVDMVFSKSAYLSVILTKLQGTARLQFSRQPYTHWSFTFIEDPSLQFEVESHFEGRPIAQLTSVIINQIRKAVRKKHTLPNYKIRYRPFFVKPVTETAPQDVYYQGNKISIGQLQVVVVGCSRLANITPESHIYCSLTLDSIQWMELMSFRRKLLMAHDVEVTRVPGQNIGLSFGEVFLVDKYEEMVVVTDVVEGSPAARADIHKSDLLMAINGVKVSSSKHAVRLMKNAGEKITLRMERAIKGFSGSGQKASGPSRNEEDATNLKAFHVTTVASDSVGEQPSALNNPSGDLETSEYVTILPLAADIEKPLHDDISSLRNFDSKSDTLSNQSASSSSSSSSAVPSSLPVSSLSAASASPPLPKKGLTQILTTGSGLFGRRRQKSDILSGSAELARTPKELSDKLPDSRPPPKLEVRANDGQGAAKKERKLQTNGGNAATLTDSVVQPPAQRENQLNRKSELQVGAVDPVESQSRESSIQQQTNSTSSSSHTDLAKMRATHYEKACSNPAFNEKFKFDVEEKHNYLNICVWNKQPEKVDKNRVIKPEKDVLLGHVSIPLMDIALECLATLQGDVTNIYNLTPSESKVETGRSQHANLASHSGFEERLCHGDVTLRFIYAMHSLSKKERENICKMKETNDLTSNRDQVSGASKDSVAFASVYSSAAAPVLSGQHHFMVTHFQTATYCHFCSKKIWLKTAFQCQLCQMVCHKKCTEKCQAQRQCSKLAKRFLKDEQQKNEEVLENHIRTGDSLERKLDDARLSDQREECEVLIGDMERKRHNSAPDESLSDSETQNLSKSLSPTTSMPRTRSSNSLVEMPMEALMMPTAKYLEDAENLSKMFRRIQNAPNSDEMVVTEAKRKGKELYADLEPEARKEKLDSHILKFQVEINNETENRTDLISQERLAKDKKIKKLLQEKIEKSDAKLQSLTIFMLHYCAGLQHCMDQEEMERQKRLEQEQVEQEQTEHEQMEQEQEQVEQRVCELKQTELGSKMEQSALTEESILQMHKTEVGVSVIEIKTDHLSENNEVNSCQDEMALCASEVEAEPFATDDCSESSVETEQTKDLEDNYFDDQKLLGSKDKEETVTAVMGEDVNLKSIKSSSREVELDEDLETSEVNAIIGVPSLKEMVGMLTPVSVCQLLGTEPGLMLEQMPPNIIEDNTKTDFLMPETLTVSAVGHTRLAKGIEKTVDSEPPEMELMMHEKVCASVVLEEFSDDAGMREVLSLPHSSIETVVSETSVINTTNSYESLALVDDEDQSSRILQKDVEPGMPATEEIGVKPVELGHGTSKY